MDLQVAAEAMCRYLCAQGWQTGKPADAAWGFGCEAGGSGACMLPSPHLFHDTSNAASLLSSGAPFRT